MPDRSTDIVRTGSSSQFGSITSNSIVPVLSLEIPDRSREETSSNEIQETSGSDKEKLKFGRGTSPNLKLDVETGNRDMMLTCTTGIRRSIRREDR